MDIQISWKTPAAQVLQPRVGIVATPHGNFSIPNFMPVGSRGSIKGVLTHELRSLGCEILLSNTYHLYLRPGSDVISAVPGTLRTFMGWDGPILTDSGGYQVFSLSNTRTITDQGVLFRSVYDGSEHLFTPEKVVEIQAKIGSTFMMQLDHLEAYGSTEPLMREAVDRTFAWYRRSLTAHRQFPHAGMLVPILQGGWSPQLRAYHLQQLMSQQTPQMMAIGGLAVGESRSEFQDILGAIMEIMPRDKITYLMGVGEPADMLYAIERGVDLFDCVLPTRNGRKGQVFTDQGKLNLRNAIHKHDPHPIQENCICPICQRYSRAYLHHLFKVKDMNGPISTSIHNLHFFFSFMKSIQAATLVKKQIAHAFLFATLVFFSFVAQATNQGCHHIDQSFQRIQDLSNHHEVRLHVRCPYCHDEFGDELTDHLVRCVQCQTVYHQDCFGMNRGCVLLGCSGRQTQSLFPEPTPDRFHTHSRLRQQGTRVFDLLPYSIQRKMSRLWQLRSFRNSLPYYFWITPTVISHFLLGPEWTFPTYMGMFLLKTYNARSNEVVGDFLARGLIPIMAPLFIFEEWFLTRHRSGQVSGNPSTGNPPIHIQQRNQLRAHR